MNKSKSVCITNELGYDLGIEWVEVWFGNWS